jgi:hypothetical protein
VVPNMKSLPLMFTTFYSLFSNHHSFGCHTARIIGNNIRQDRQCR